MKNADKNARDVILSLRKFRDDIDEIMNPLYKVTSISSEEKIAYQLRFKDLKTRLRLASKRGTTDCSDRPLTEIETIYFQPSVMEAIANCHVATNSHPIKSNWKSALYDMRIEITHMLNQLEKLYPTD